MKYLFSLFFCLCISWAHAQAPDSLKLPIDPETHLITYSEVVQMPGITQAELYTRAKLWFAESFKSAKAVVQADEKEAGFVQGTAWSPMEAHFLGPRMSPTKMRLYYTVKLACREGRYRYEITQFQDDANAASEPHPMEHLIEVWDKNAALKGNKPSKYSFARDELKAAVATTSNDLATSIKSGMARKPGSVAGGKDW